MTAPSPFRLQSLIDRAKAAMTAYTTQFASEMAAADAAIANLNSVASMAQGAITTSATDRAALHTQADATTTALTALTSRVTALEAAEPAFGTATTPALALLASKDITVTLNQAMPTTTYTAKTLVDPAFAGKLTATVKTQTTNTVVVTISAVVALGASSITVIAWT